MQLIPVVDLPELGRTALFGRSPFTLNGTDSYALAEALVLAGPDFAFNFLEGQVITTSVQGDLVLRGIGALPLAMPPLRVVMPLEIADSYGVFSGIDNITVDVGSATTGSLISLHPCSIIAKVGDGPWSIEVVAKPGAPTGQAIATVTAEMFAFDVTEMAFNEAGVTHCVAKVQPGTVQLGQHQIEVTAGSLTMRGKRIEAVLEAQLHVAGFSNASVALTMTARRDDPTTGWVFDAVAQVPSNEVWTDPSGFLRFEKMAISLAITGTGAELRAALTASGRVTFLASKMAASAKEWLGGLFEGMSVDFDGEELGGWGDLPTLTFRPVNGLRLKALDIFDMQIPVISFGKLGLSFSNLSLGVNVGGTGIKATLPRLDLNLGDMPSLKLSLREDGNGENPISLGVELTVPAGIKAYGALIYKEGRSMQALSGWAKFSTPTLPSVDVMFQIGRMRFKEGEDWEPLFLLYAEAPTNIPVFPGVVIQRIGLGAGVNFAVEGITGLSFAEAQKRVQRGDLPDVSQEKSWVPAQGNFTMAARAFAASSPGGDESRMELYIADLTFVLTSNFQLAASLKMWFQTSLKDAKLARFQDHASVVALANFDGNEPSLRLVAMTKSDGLSSMGEEGAAGKLLSVNVPDTRLAFEAKPSGMALVIGPNRSEGEIGPLKLNSESLLAFRSVQSRVFVLFRNAINARFHVTARTDFGLVSFSASVTAEFASNLVLWGQFTDGALTVYGNASATFVVEVSLHVRIGFRIEISIPFGSITIEYHNDWDFGLQVHVDMELEMALSTAYAPGVNGKATVGVSVLGISASIPLSVEFNSRFVNNARADYEKNVKEHMKELGV